MLGRIISRTDFTSRHRNISNRKLNPVCNYRFFVPCALVVFCMSEARMSVWDLPPSDISRGSYVHVGHLALHLPSLCDVKCQPAASRETRESKVSLHSNADVRKSSHLTPNSLFLFCGAIKTVREGKFKESLT